MSVNRQIDDGAGGGDGGDEERSKQKKSIGYGSKAKKVLLSRIKKAKKRLQKSKTKEIGNSGCFSCWYIRSIPAMDSSSESPTSDPNCSEFEFDSLRGLIERSDFLLNECNTHLDVYTPDDRDDD